MGNKHTNFALALVLLFGIALFYTATDGFRAFTAETARVNELMKTKPAFPDALLEDSNERIYPFSSFHGKYVLVTFIYTSCATLCVELETNMSQVYQQIPAEYIGEDILFLSISFDPAQDDPATLDRYKNYFDSDGETWRMARIPDENQLDSVLKALGVIVIPDQNGNFAHNAAFYLIDRRGLLADVMKYTEIEAAAQAITAILDEEQDAPKNGGRDSG